MHISASRVLLEFLKDVTYVLDQGTDVDVIYLDFRKAFDKVPHKRLLKKLWGYGIRDSIYAWIKDCLKDRKQYVKVDGRRVTSGVPQGSVLGPVLFLIFINDLPEVVTAVIKLFADDAKIYRGISTMEHAYHLQSSIDNAVIWADQWKMFYNFEKCKHLHIGSRNEDIKYTMNTGQEVIEIETVTSERDLGVITDKALNFSEHINTKVNKANRNLGIIFRTFTFMGKEMFLNLYKSLVRPHLEYAITACAPLHKKDMIIIENVQRRATKLVRSISHLSYSERLKSLGLPSLEYRRERADVVEVYKIMNQIDNIDKDKFFTSSLYTTTRGHSMKLFKKQHRLKLRSNSFSICVVDAWNSLPDSVVTAPSLDSFKAEFALEIESTQVQPLVLYSRTKTK